MKVVLKPATGFMVETEDGKSLGKFDRGEEWRGMMELTRGSSTLIVELGSGLEDMLSRMFSLDDKKILSVVKGSVDIIGDINKPHFDRT